MSKFTRDSDGAPICEWCDHLVMYIQLGGFFTTVAFGLAAIWGFDPRWAFTSLVVTVIASFLSLGRS